jgi:hypothetical protein
VKRIAAKKILERDELARGPGVKEDSIGPLGVIFSIILIATAVFVLDYGVLPPAYPVNSVAQDDVKARLDFRYNDVKELNDLRDEAARRAPHVYVEDPNWVDDQLKDLAELVDIVENAGSVGDAHDRSARYPMDKNLVTALYNYKSEFQPESRKRFGWGPLIDRIRLSLRTIAADGVLKGTDLDIERNKQGEVREIIRVSKAPQPGTDPARSELRPRVSVVQLKDTVAANDRFSHANWQESLTRYEELRTQLIDHFRRHLTTPNLLLDKERTQTEADRARDAVGAGEIQVRKGETILTKGQYISQSMLDKLHQEYRAYKKAMHPKERLRQLAGLTTLVFGVLISFLFVASRLDEAIYRRRRAMVMLGLLCLAELATVRLVLLAGLSPALAPLVFIAIVVSLAFEQSVALLALFGLTLLSLFAGIIWEASPVEVGVPTIPLAMLVGAIAAALPARSLQDRWDLLRSGAVGGIAQGVLVVGLSMLSPNFAGMQALGDASLASINGLICGLLVLGSLPLIEPLFGILSNIRLFELADLNQPALKRLQMEAPGTFAHTLQVKFLAEPASDAIGANTRLVSAGVLYHDLGKTLKPEYFVENQMDAEALHQRLRPSVSALLITAHVKDGIELAREYRLPHQIIDFIPEHHGTTLVSYFFHSAQKSAEAQARADESGTGPKVEESFFRYPGPTPQSRETGIVMLADTIEAASRTLSTPSASRLQSFVHDLVMEKMLDGQLDECNLTFADLALIEDSFCRVLVTRFHSRIRYPGQSPDGSTEEMARKTTVMEPPPGTAVPTPKPEPSTARRNPLTETGFLVRRESSKESPGP